MKHFFIWLLFGLSYAAWESAFFEADYFDRNSLKQGSCYYICKKDEKVCNTLAHMGCELIDDSTHLVEGYEKDVDSVKIWAKEPFKKVPHFLVISRYGEIVDWSANEAISPSLDYGELDLSDGGDIDLICAAYDPENRQIFFRGAKGESLYTTYLGKNQKPTKLAEKDPLKDRWMAFRTCVSSPSGKSLIVYVNPGNK